MFTGIITSTGQVRSFTAAGTGAVLVVDLNRLAADVHPGESVAINGVCLTITRLAGSQGSFDVSEETLARSTLGTLRTGNNVNLELALKLGDRLGGHMVQGHVDGIAVMSKIQPSGEFMTIHFDTDPEVLNQLIPKGSVAVDGISLTVAALNDQGFTVAIIPETARVTTLGSAKTGDRVNLETDMIVKTVRRYLDGLLPKEAGSFTVQKLREIGF
jgi:riboflavin synthase